MRMVLAGLVLGVRIRRSMGCGGHWVTVGDAWRGGHPACAGAVGLGVLVAMDAPGKGSKSGYQKGNPTKERSLVGDQARLPAMQEGKWAPFWLF